MSETEDSRQSLQAFGELLPIFAHANEFIAKRETELYAKHMAGELQKATDELERLDQSKSDFIAVAAHELKTPLTLIEGMLQCCEKCFRQIFENLHSYSI